MPKRSFTNSQTTSSPSDGDEIDEKPASSESSENEDCKPDSTPSKKAKRSPKKKKDGEPKRVETKWSKDEDEVFVGLMEAHLKATFWQAVKDDGRLAYRGGNGVRAHVVAFIKKAKKS